MTYKFPEINKKDIEKLIAEKIQVAEAIDRNINNKIYKLKRITLPIDQMYYNIKNVRTSIEAKEYIKQNKLAENFFDQGEYHNLTVQNSYHSVIYKEVLDKKKNDYDTKFKTNKESQTEEVYINLDGILINGNSRVSYWRENQTFQTIDCLVFCEKYPWLDLLAAVNYIDSDVDIRQKYAWYNRADQAREFLEIDDSKENLKKVAIDCAYGSPSKVLVAINELELAEEYLNIGFENCSKFSDMQDTGSGGGNNYYAFRDIAKGIRTLENLKFDDGDKAKLEIELKQQSFSLVYDFPSGYGSIHNNLEELWREDNLKSKLKEMSDESDMSTGGGLLDDEPEDKDEGLDKDDSIKIKPIVDKEKNKALLDKLKREKAARAIKTDAEKPAKMIKSIVLDINSIIQNINSNTDIKKLKSAFKDLENAVEENKKKLSV